MALGKTIATLQAKLTVDTKDFTKGLAEAAAELKASTEAMKSEGGAAGDLQRATEKLASSHDDLKKAASDVNSELNRSAQAFARAQSPLGGLSKAYDDLRGEMTDTITKSKDLRTGIDAVKKSFDGTTVAGQQMRKALRDVTGDATTADNAFRDLAVTLSKDVFNTALKGEGITPNISSLLTGSLLSGTGGTGGAGGEAGAAASAGGGGLSAFLGVAPVVTALAAAIAGLTAAFAPFLVVIGSAIILLAGFTAGLAGLLAVTGIFVGAFGAMSVAAVLLTKNTAPVKNALTQLESAFKGVGQSVGAIVGPTAVKTIQFLTSLAPLATKVADAFAAFYAKNQPVALDLAGDAANILAKALTQLLGPLQNFVNGFKKLDGPGTAIFSQLSQAGVQAINGLLQNLLKLSDWFTKEWPTIGPEVGQILSFIGGITMDLVKDFGQLVDYIASNWPAIIKFAQEWWHDIQLGWNAVMQFWGAIVQLTGGFQVLKIAWDYIISNAQYLRPLLFILGGLFAAMVIIVFSVIASLVALAVGITALMRSISWLVNNVRAQWGALWSFVSSEARSIWSSTGNWLISQWSVLVGDATARWNQIRSAISGPMRALRSDLSSIWNGIVSDSQKVVTGVESVLNSLINAINGLGIPGLKLHTIGTSSSSGGSGGGGALQGFANGGIVGGGYGGGDRVHAMLTPGEGVVSLRGMGGLGAGMFDAINSGKFGMGAGTALGNLSALVGTVGGQCLAWVTKMTGLFAGVPAAIDLMGDINSHTPSAGEIFVMDIAPYGHTGFVLGPAAGGQVPVIDSNWNLDEVIRAHTIPETSIAGYINRNIGIGALGSALTAMVNPAATVETAVQTALGKVGAIGGWPPGMAKGLITMIGQDVTKAIGSSAAAVVAQAAKAATGKGANYGRGGGSSSQAGRGAGPNANTSGNGMQIHWHAYGNDADPNDLVRALSWGRHAGQF